MSFHDRKQGQTISFTRAMTAVKKTLTFELAKENARLAEEIAVRAQTGGNLKKSMAETGDLDRNAPLKAENGLHFWKLTGNSRVRR